MDDWIDGRLLWPEPEKDLLLMIDDDVVEGYWDYGSFRNSKHEVVYPSYWKYKN